MNQVKKPIHSAGADGFDPGEGIAIIGMAGRFPGARNLDEFWSNLAAGVESVSFFSVEELERPGAGALNATNYVRAKAVLEDVDLFDASFFDFNPREAELMDPQHRLFLECAWEALENAGYAFESDEGIVGVFAGSTTSGYLINVFSRPDLVKTLGSAQVMVGNDKDHLAMRVSYKLNLKGPSITVQTSCSTSLVATHLACRSLLSYECDMALAGGVSVTLPQKSGYFYNEGGILSPDGHCRVFDAKSAGTVSGNGLGVVVLQRLRDAIAGRASIYGVIKATAVNNDGASKVGYLAPGVAGQSRVIKEALDRAGVAPETISYLEAHGTGTILGDPVEVHALTEAFRARAKRKAFCALGSVKSNIGHLDAAAGIAGLIKTTLALTHRLIPPTINFEQPNPQIDFENGPFYVNTKLSAWDGIDSVRRAGVSSFGIGGTNAHVILEEAPVADDSSPSRPWHLLVLSAKTDTALEKATSNLAELLKRQTDTKLADVAYTLQIGRKAFGHRRALVCRDTEDAIETLVSRDSKKMFTTFQESRNKPVFFIFAGQGTQQVNMALEVYQAEAAFREQIDFCSSLLQPHLGLDLREVLYPDEDRLQEAARKLNKAAISQPALFMVEYALAKTLMRWGIRPQAMIGHSLGEYVAACIADVFSLEEGLQLMVVRGRLMEELPKGAMLAVALSAAELQSLISEPISLAAVNGPARCVVSGPTEAIEALESQFNASGVACRRLRTTHAFHSSMTAPILERFSRHVARIKLNPPKIPYISNLTGSWVTTSEATNPGYWARHLRQTVRFNEGLERMTQDRLGILLEIGPDGSLSKLAQQHPNCVDKRLVLPCLPSPNEGRSQEEFLMKTLGRLWMAGGEVDWRGFYDGQRRRRISLPTYPFERKRYWIERRETAPGKESGAGRTRDGLGDERHSSRKQNRALSQVTEEVLVSNPKAALSGANGRYSTILSSLKSLAHELTGMEAGAIDIHSSFFELGVDSLLLIQTSQAIHDRFGVDVPYRLLFEELSTLDALATYIERELPAQAAAPNAVSNGAAPPPEGQTPLALTGVSGGGNEIGFSLPSGSAVERIVARQLEIMSQQLALLRGGHFESDARSRIQATEIRSAERSDRDLGASDARPIVPELIVKTTANGLSESAEKESGEVSEPFVPYKPIEMRPVEGLTPSQSKYLNSFIERYCKRTGKSKQFAQKYRSALADPRASLGFRLQWKELIYPLVCERSSGSKLWDIDGNEYIDLAMGFGVHLFGHSPAFISDALGRQLGQGIQLGPQSNLAGRVAELICELTGFERVIFCNSGTEAVMSAMRVARAVSGRQKIALFAGSYHGSFDGTLAKASPVNADRNSVPIAPGTPAGMIEDVIVLDYARPESLEILESTIDELAAVLVEPVQSRCPSLQPRDFLMELRRLTDRGGAALIFDEVITGFRVSPGGAQEWFGVRADMAIYGKVIGGGMPIGVVAGNSAYMDAFDGGSWSFGDSSYPPARQTFFAGTFFKHPLTMAASLAVLERIKEEGPGLQQLLNRRASEFVGALNNFLGGEQAPVRIESFGSLLCFTSSRNFKFADLFFHHLVEKGVFVWEGRTCFLSTAHSEEDLNQVVLVVQQTVKEMQEGGFWQDTTPSQFIGKHQANSSSDSTPSPVSTYPGDVDIDPGQPRLAPLTEGQEQIWTACQIGEHASRAYNESINLRMRGRLDAQSMRRAIQRLVDRHDALRTVIGGDGKHQRILPSLALDIPLVDLSDVSDSELEAQSMEWATREARQIFDLTEGPLLRARIIRLRQEYHYLLLTLHHLIADGWSSGVLVRELKSLYAAECQGVACELPEPMQYAEYAEWQSSILLTEKMERAEQYWLDRFSDSVPVLELPTDRSRRPTPTFNGSTASLAIDTSIYLSLKNLSGRLGTTVFTTLLGGFTLLLHRLSGQDDLVVGIAAAGQISAGGPSGAMNLVGHCVNALPLRSILHSDLWFTEYVDGVKNSVLDAYEHQDYPVARLINKLNLPSAPGRSPFIAASFNLDRATPGFEFLGLEVEMTTIPSGSSKFDLSLNIIESDRDLLVNCDFNTDLFDEETIQRWLGHFRTLLVEITTKADHRVSELSLLTDLQKRQLLAEWDDNGARSSGDLCIQQMFEIQAASAPDAVALIFDGEEVTYQDLNASANRIAHRLRSLGVGPETRVGICAERSPEMVAALFAVLKAGGAFVPLDPEYPKERLAFMMDDAQISILLTQQRLAIELPEHEAQTLFLDSAQTSLAQESDFNPVPIARPGNLAYLIYTSGTTGRPKAVMIERRNIANCMLASQAWFGFSSDLVMPFICRFSFDIALFELLSPLLVGGTSILLTRQESLNIARLAKVLEKATFLQSLPSLMRQIVSFATENEFGRKFNNVTQILMGGDLVPRDLLTGVRRVFPKARIYEGYGPAECAILATSYLTPDDVTPQKHIIGRPLSNMKVAIFDKLNQLVPIGVPGELYIAGAGVGRGYFNREDLTKERYITVETQRFYKTGDLARRLPDGNIEFLGRIDHQVKIRGYRIELGEIEWALENHADVQSAVVTAWEETSGDKRLVAYLVLDRNANPSVSELRSFLRKTLPDYMTPSAFLIMDALPLTPNGKVDREALPVPNQDRPILEEEFVAPRNPVEERLVGIWGDVLNISQVGVHDNFFELGGNSLQATQILSRLREEVKVDLGLDAFFESPTVAELAVAVVRSDTANASGARIEALSRGERSLEDLLSEVDQLSDYETRTLLSRERSGSREVDAEH